LAARELCTTIEAAQTESVVVIRERILREVAVARYRAPRQR
jgi:hypothetical protein